MTTEPFPSPIPRPRLPAAIEFDETVRALEAERRRGMPHTFHNQPRDMLGEIEARREGTGQRTSEGR